MWNSALYGAFSSAMQNAEIYRKYAEDCKQLAQQAPLHRDALQKIAAAWLTLAEQAEPDGKGVGNVPEKKADGRR